jgi:lipoate-protein ligase A
MLQKGFEQVLEIKLEVGELSDFERELARELVKKKYSKQTWLEKYE